MYEMARVILTCALVLVVLETGIILVIGAGYLLVWWLTTLYRGLR